MTTIVVKDREMFCDSLTTSGNFADSDNTIKIEKINGHLVGAAGRWSSCLAFREWYHGIQSVVIAAEAFPEAAQNMVYPEPGCDDDLSFNALILDTDGILTMFEGNYAAYTIDQSYYAIGSGGEHAICVMDAGVDGHKATEVAIKRDVYSGGNIYRISLDDDIITMNGEPMETEGGVDE
jgi:ATP-dependent protease HslVU (ClpYQ) peptidase subunit